MTLIRSVTTRLILAYCVLLLLLGGAFVLFTALSFQRYSRATVSQALAARADEIESTTQGLLDKPANLSKIIDRRFAPDRQGRFVRIRLGDRVIYRSGNPIDRDFDPRAIPLSSAIGEPHAQMVGDLLLYTKAFPNPGGAAITIETGQTYKFIRGAEESLVKTLLIGLPILLVCSGLAGYFLMRRALTPVEVMINAAEEITFNDPHSRLPLVGSEPRIEALALALNRMLDRLDNAYTHVNRFSADAAHELRTPLTIIRGELEYVASEKPEPKETGRAVSIALEEMTRLSAMVDSLITLSRMDSLWGKRVHSDVDLLALASETVDQMNLLAEDKDIRLEPPTGEPIVVAGDRDRIKQVFVNVVDNAIKYSTAGGRVGISVHAESDIAVVTISDSGIGIPAEFHERVFDRFYRVSTDRGEIGAGLGLAIVRSICNAHGGTVTLKSTPGEGSSFRIELPLRGVGARGAN